MNKNQLPSISSKQHISMPVGNKVIVTISRVNGKTGQVDDIATGKYNSETKSWSFSGKENATNVWLDNAFNNSNNGKIKYLKDDEAYLVYLMTSVVSRKGLSMDWTK